MGVVRAILKREYGYLAGDLRPIWINGNNVIGCIFGAFFSLMLIAIALIFCVLHLAGYYRLVEHLFEG